MRIVLLIAALALAGCATPTLNPILGCRTSESPDEYYPDCGEDASGVRSPPSYASEPEPTRASVQRAPDPEPEPEPEDDLPDSPNNPNWPGIP